MTRPHFRFPAVLAMAVIGQLAFAGGADAEEAEAVPDHMHEARDIYDMPGGGQAIDVDRLVEEIAARLPASTHTVETRVETQTEVREVPAAINETFSAGFEFANAACKGGVPGANVHYDRDSDNVASHARITLGPDGNCEIAASVDTEISKRVATFGRWYTDVTGGYDRHAVAQNYTANRRLTRVTESVTAAVNFGHDFGVWTIEAGANFAGQDRCYEDAMGECDVRHRDVVHRIAATGKIGEVELDLESNGLVETVTASFDWRGNAVTLSAVNDADRLAHDFPMSHPDDAASQRKGSPDEVIFAATLGWEF